MSRGVSAGIGVCGGSSRVFAGMHGRELCSRILLLLPSICFLGHQHSNHPTLLAREAGGSFGAGVSFNATDAEPGAVCETVCDEEVTCMDCTEEEESDVVSLSGTAQAAPDTSLPTNLLSGGRPSRGKRAQP